MTKLQSGIAVVACLVVAGLAAACNWSKPAPAVSVSAKGSKAAPDFTLKDGDGKTVRLSDYRGKVVLLNFWATWCGPCKVEIPWFMDFQRKNKDRGFVVIGVSMDEDGWDAVKPFVNRLGINYRVLLGNDSVSAAYGGVDALPTTFLIDREGNIAATHVGLAAKSDFEDGIEQLLQGGSGGARRVSLPGLFIRTAR